MLELRTSGEVVRTIEGGGPVSDWRSAVVTSSSATRMAVSGSSGMG